MIVHAKLGLIKWIKKLDLCGSGGKNALTFGKSPQKWKMGNDKNNRLSTGHL